VAVVGGGPPVDVAVNPPELEVTVYFVIADPPSLAGAVHVTVADPFPAVAVPIVGAPGSVLGVTVELAEDAGEGPAVLVATTVNVYPVPLVSPATGAVVGGGTPPDPVDVAVNPPGVEVTV